MEIRQLRHFVAVAETLNFREAAERCAITQQAMSKSIMQLEARLGFKLLDRDRKSVLPTAFGEHPDRGSDRAVLLAIDYRHLPAKRNKGRA